MLMILAIMLGAWVAYAAGVALASKLQSGGQQLVCAIVALQLGVVGALLFSAATGSSGVQLGMMLMVGGLWLGTVCVAAAAAATHVARVRERHLAEGSSGEERELRGW
jgi:hypothetical protein